MPDSTVILNTQTIQRSLTRIAHEIAERNESSSDVVLVGIQRGGVPLAKKLSAALAEIWKHPVPAGSLDVSMHRDDLGHRAAPNVQPTVIPFDVTGKTVVLVIHGLKDSQATWTPMINKLRGDPVIRKHYQFWFYSYPTGYPFPYSRQFYATKSMAWKKRFPKMKPMVVISHSMGGCISRCC